MAAPIEQTSVEGGEGQNEAVVDYVELLRVALRQKKLMYIADVVLEVEEFTLEQLLKWTRNDLIELLADINNDNDNNHKIKVSHRNKFADAVCNIAAKQKEALEKKSVAPAASSGPSSQVKLLFLGKEEEEAIEEIQSGQQLMDKNLDKMKELFNKLDESNKNIKQDLSAICKSLKQQIDEKEKQMISTIDSIYQYHLNALNSRNEVSQQSAKVVAKFYNDYENYFTDNKLTKSDRRTKLVAAKESIAAEVDKIKKHKDTTYDMEIALNKQSADQFLAQFLNLKKTGIDIPAINAIDSDDTVLKWKPPELKDDIVAIMKQQTDDSKEDTELLINYRILYGDEEIQDDEKKGDNWKQVDNIGKESQYDMKAYAPCHAAIQYTINNNFESPISQSVTIKQPSYSYIARWSSAHKGNNISLSENNCKAQMSSGASDQSVRAENPIQKGTIVTLNYTFYCPSSICEEMVGLVSSEYDGNWGAAKTCYGESECRKYAYGLMCNNCTSQYFGEYTNVGWDAGSIPTGKEVTIAMVVDYKTYDTCCLSLYMDGTFIGPENAKYSMKLPKLSDDHVWYPATCFDYTNNWCKITCVSVQ